MKFSEMLELVAQHRKEADEYEKQGWGHLLDGNTDAFLEAGRLRRHSLGWIKKIKRDYWYDWRDTWLRWPFGRRK